MDLMTIAMAKALSGGGGIPMPDMSAFDGQSVPVVGVGGNVAWRPYNAVPFNPVDSTTNGLLLAVLKQVLFPTAKASADKTASYYTGWGAGDALGFLGNILPLDQDSLTNGLEQLGAFSVTDNNVELVFVCESFAVDKSDGTRVAQATFCSTYVDTSGDTPGAYDISLTWHVEDPSTAYVIASCRYSAPQPLPLNGN